MTRETARLLLRPWREEDAAALYCAASDPLVGPAAGWSPHGSVEESREIIRTVLSAPENFAVCLKEEPDAPVGSIGFALTTTPDAAGEQELGYWLARPLWGQGLIPEAARELLRYAFEEKGLPRVWCSLFEGNEKSRRVIEKCGFSYRLTHTTYLPQLGEERRARYYTITKEQWKHG